MLGEGPGRLLEVLVKKLPCSRFVVVDQSQAMLNQALTFLKADSQALERVDWIHGNALEVSFGVNKFDLVTTPFFLDCFTEAQLSALIPHISEHCSDHAEWLLMDFQIPSTGGWRKVRARWIHSLMYFFFRQVTGIAAPRWIDPDPFMKSAGFRLQSRIEFNFGLIRSDLWKRKS